MSDLALDVQGKPTTPAASSAILYPDSRSKIWTGLDDAGKARSNGGVLANANSANVVANAADTYLTGSEIIVPNHGLQALTTFHWRASCSKTAAGVAAATFNVRVGIAGTVADASRLLFTLAAQTAVVDVGFFDIIAVLRNVGAAGVMAGVITLQHNNAAATGLAGAISPVIEVVGAAFDTTPANQIVGLSCNPGAAGVWTFTAVTGRANGM
jgi:hypothetical protein